MLITIYGRYLEMFNAKKIFICDQQNKGGMMGTHQMGSSRRLGIPVHMGSRRQNYRAGHSALPK